MSVTEGLRWQVTKAVRASDLPPPSRLIMLVLSDVAEVGTAEIPERFTPSIRVLAVETGLNASTVKRHLAALERAGWIKRSAPDRKGQAVGERTRYWLAVPYAVDVVEPVAAPDPGAESATPPAQRAPTRGAEKATPPAHSAPPDKDLSSDQNSPSESSSRRQRKADVEPRPDVAQVCAHLADRIEGNGSKRPTITQTWRDAARRLLDRDERTVDQVLRAIDWSQDHHFWRSNIMSMPKLREQYDQLRLQAQREARGPGTGVAIRDGPRPSTTDQRVAAGLALYAEYATEGSPPDADPR